MFLLDVIWVTLYDLIFEGNVAFLLVNVVFNLVYLIRYHFYFNLLVFFNQGFYIRLVFFIVRLAFIRNVVFFLDLVFVHLYLVDIYLDLILI